MYRLYAIDAATTRIWRMSPVRLFMRFAGRESVEKIGHNVLHRRRVQRIHDLLTAPISLDEIGLLEHGEVMGHGRRRRFEMACNVSGRLLAVAKQAKDGSPGRVRQGFEGIIPGHMDPSLNS